MKQKRIITDDFFIGNLGNLEVTKHIISCCPDELLSYNQGTVGKERFKNHNQRKCQIAWLGVGKSNFIETGLRSIINNVNDMIWNIEIDNEWDTNIQFTKYSGKGDHYDWHIDTMNSEGLGNRKISVVYCLSHKSEYTGGNFEIKKSDKSVHTTKFDYGDFIVFPSDRQHRVLPLKSGNRLTMVGWLR
jgi:hypothetical protein